MTVYINVATGREIVRSRPDPWLEKSAGWVRVEGDPLDDEVTDAPEGVDEEESDGWS